MKVDPQPWHSLLPSTEMALQTSRDSICVFLVGGKGWRLILSIYLLNNYKIKSKGNFFIITIEMLLNVDPLYGPNWTSSSWLDAEYNAIIIEKSQMLDNITPIQITAIQQLQNTNTHKYKEEICILLSHSFIWWLFF